MMVEPGAGRDEGGDRALHIDGAPAVEKPAAYLGRERIAAPAFAGRHNVEMAGKAEMRAAISPGGEQILDRSVGCLAGDEAMDFEGGLLKGNRRLED